MKPVKKIRKKLVIKFDSEARREYLTGFRKRKKLRKAKAKLQNVKQAKQRKKEEKHEKSEEVRKKLDKYGLANDEDQDGVKGKNGPMLDHHPNHVVVIDTQPQFGPSLSSMVDETEPSSKHRILVKLSSASQSL